VNSRRDPSTIVVIGGTGKTNPRRNPLTSSCRSDALAKIALTTRGPHKGVSLVTGRQQP
jgi:hypothetical protein